MLNQGLFHSSSSTEARVNLLTEQYADGFCKNYDGWLSTVHTPQQPLTREKPRIIHSYWYTGTPTKTI